MEHSAPRRLRLVKIRPSGAQEDVDRVVGLSRSLLPADEPSKPYPNRRDPATVRVYLEVSPE
ncbi:hypothetical protein O4J56_06945 [Nocardiopsis sp. RSe5-2]|uniref:Uncharacterized protein n=1 Tax=Nocardiopsis endophytica TaxID=3018445 RepID=A0ABT4U1X5_9ACTN|nr:hypothetical protein [Nocardiopsis endophytica]MDA2810372.1 hypothetical protein [Nocardiopsis endophytica]